MVSQMNFEQNKRTQEYTEHVLVLSKAEHDAVLQAIKAGAGNTDVGTALIGVQVGTNKNVGFNFKIRVDEQKTPPAAPPAQAQTPATEQK